MRLTLPRILTNFREDPVQAHAIASAVLEEKANIQKQKNLKTLVQIQNGPLIKQSSFLASLELEAAFPGTKAKIDSSFEEWRKRNPQATRNEMDGNYYTQVAAAMSKISLDNTPTRSPASATADRERLLSYATVRAPRRKARNPLDFIDDDEPPKRRISRNRYSKRKGSKQRRYLSRKRGSRRRYR